METKCRKKVKKDVSFGGKKGPIICVLLLTNLNSTVFSATRKRKIFICNSTFKQEYKKITLRFQ